MIQHFEKIKEYILTKWTGKNKQTRDWEEWLHNTICYRADSVENYYANFKHIIRVNPDKVFNHKEPFDWVPVEGFKQYEYPQKVLGDNAVINWFRVTHNPWSNRHEINGMGGEDLVFAATNNDEDAVMIALIYG